MSEVHGFAGGGLGGGSSVEETEEESDDDDIGEDEPPSKQAGGRSSPTDVDAAAEDFDAFNPVKEDFEVFTEPDQIVHGCEMCLATFETEEALDDHVSSFHTKVFHYHCPMPDCSYKTHSLINFKAHLQTEHGQSEMSEGEVLLRKVDARINRKRAAANGDEEVFTCQICGISFVDVEAANDHANAEHEQVWSLTQFYSIIFSLTSRISVKKCVFTNTHNQGLRQLFLMVSWDLCA